MHKKLNSLSFVIGAFFTIVSIILFINMFVTGTMDTVTIYSASVFFIFGVAMMFTG